MERSQRWNNLKICPRRDSNTSGSDLWSNTLPLDHGGAPNLWSDVQLLYHGCKFHFDLKLPFRYIQLVLELIGVWLSSSSSEQILFSNVTVNIVYYNSRTFKTFLVLMFFPHYFEDKFLLRHSFTPYKLYRLYKARQPTYCLIEILTRSSVEQLVV